MANKPQHCEYVTEFIATWPTFANKDKKGQPWTSTRSRITTAFHGAPSPQPHPTSSAPKNTTILLNGHGAHCIPEGRTPLAHQDALHGVDCRPRRCHKASFHVLAQGVLQTFQETWTRKLHNCIWFGKFQQQPIRNASLYVQYSPRAHQQKLTARNQKPRSNIRACQDGPLHHIVQLASQPFHGRQVGRSERTTR